LSRGFVANFRASAYKKGGKGAILGMVFWEEAMGNKNNNQH
jgi:hypothetical protein